VTTQQCQRPQWATYNTWDRTRRRSKTARKKARRQLAELIDSISATLAATQNRSNTMSQYDEQEAERRQQARRDLIARCGNPPRRERPARPRTERDDRLAAGLIFSDRQEAIEQAEGEHWGRRRRAEQELASHQRRHDSARRDWRKAWAPDGDDAA
jgi:hypothetical protein